MSVGDSQTFLLYSRTFCSSVPFGVFLFYTSMFLISISQCPTNLCLVTTVQLWTTSNYHWYLKMELPAPGAGRFTSVLWHVEDPARLLLSTTGK